MKFLEKIADELFNRYQDDWKNYAIIFPNRRASLFFQKYLLKRVKAPLWLPSFFSFEDFAEEISGFKTAESIPLLFDLYEIYKDTAVSYKKSFEEFYSWGKMILKDFDDIDRHLVDTEKLFRHLRDLKDIEDINRDEQSKLYQKYLKFWNELELLYNKLLQKMESDKKAYSGLVFKKAALAVRDRKEMKWDRYIFAGINMLNPSEEMIVRVLKNDNKGVDDCKSKIKCYFNFFFSYTCDDSYH